MMEERKLIRTDRNGTKYYSVTEPCMQCGGTGHIAYYNWYDNGVCFGCGGTGKHTYTEKVMLPEYEAKLMARRKARQEKKEAEARAKAVETNKIFLEKEGFNEEGKTYVVLGRTYGIKDQLKELGCKFNPILGWHSAQNLEEYETLEMSVGECCEENYLGEYAYRSFEEVRQIITAANNKLRASKSCSEYVGEVGEKLELILKLNKVFIYPTQYYLTDMHIYNFTDEKGNVYVWKTTSAGLREDTEYKVKGKVKEHSEYEGIKQTILTRCKCEGC